MRLAPATSFIGRTAVTNTVVNGTKINQGQTVLIPTYNISIDPRYWHYADPQQFVPARFLNDDQHHPRLALMAFGGGHRGCLGKDVAWIHLKMIIVRLMQHGIIFEDTPENQGGFSEETVCFPKHLVVRVRLDRPSKQMLSQ